MSDSIRAALERLLSDIQDLSDSSQGIVGLHRNGDPAPWNELLEGGRYSSWLGDAITAARAALAEQQGEGPSEYEWKDIGDGRPVQVQRCHKCGVCPSNVDDCGHFGDSRCPYFGIDALAAPSAPEPVGEGPSDKELNILWNCSGIADEHGNHTGNIFEFARAVLARWGRQPARLRNCPTHGQQPPEAWGCPECVRELREELHRTTVPVQPTPPVEGEVAELMAWLRESAEDEQNADVRRMCEIILGNTFGNKELDSLALLVGHHPDVLNASPSYWEQFRQSAIKRWNRRCTAPAGEVAKLVAKLRRLAPHNPLGTADPTITRAAELLQQQEAEIQRLRAQQTPVPVSERPWEREGWCDDEGRCWCMSSLDGPPPRWWLVRPEPLSDGWVLPAHALPLPQGEVE